MSEKIVGMNDLGQAVLPTDGWAIIWHPETGWSLVTPNPKDPTAQVPTEALALTACFIRLSRDGDFIGDMSEEFVGGMDS